MSIWVKVAAYSLGGAILGTMIIGTLLSGAGSTNNYSTGTYGFPGSYGGYANGYGNTYQLPQGGYVTGTQMGMSSSRGGCKDRR